MQIKSKVRRLKLYWTHELLTEWLLTMSVFNKVKVELLHVALTGVHVQFTLSICQGRCWYMSRHSFLKLFSYLKKVVPLSPKVCEKH